jgi:hypothetical protein
VVLPKHFDDTLKKVNLLLNRIYSSREFKDSLYAHSFNDSTFSKVKSACFAKEINENTHRIEGSNVYNNLTAEKVIKLDLVVQETLNKTKTQGFSNACVYKITSNDYWMGEDQPLAYRYVRHIAHEFTHIRGYRHDNKVAKEYKWGRDPGLWCRQDRGEYFRALDESRHAGNLNEILRKKNSFKNDLQDTNTLFYGNFARWLVEYRLCAGKSCREESFRTLL